ncbi:MAG TPA: CYTH domain-containing protein [Bacilli bacterium]|nr:CYTH domain-containing protein [Bacilli bacterium]
MSTNVEIEAKILVSEDEFHKVCRFLGIDESIAIKQCNYYIDTPSSQLRRYGFGLRIRERVDTYTLTLKSPLAEGTLEKNQTISKSSYLKLVKDNVFPDGTVKHFLVTLGFPVEDLRIITKLTTYRIDTTFLDRNLALDKNEYADIIDYEIESEQSAISLALETLKTLCEKADIEYRPNSISKHARALNALNNKN